MMILAQFYFFLIKDSNRLDKIFAQLDRRDQVSDTSSPKHVTVSSYFIDLS